MKTRKKTETEKSRKAVRVSVKLVRRMKHRYPTGRYFPRDGDVYVKGDDETCVDCHCHCRRVDRLRAVMAGPVF